MLTVTNLQVEHLRETLGIGTTRPRLSWIIHTTQPDWQQSGYQMQLFDADGTIRGDTERIASDQSSLVAWQFPPLASRERVSVRVRVWGNHDDASDWSEPVSIEAGLLEATDWSARFITPDWNEDLSQPQPAPLFRREFEVRTDVNRARLYITALGVYEAQLNGETIGEQVMAPGWTSYHHRVRFQAFDVTKLLHRGRNALGALVGDGWYRGRLGFGGGRRNLYGDRLALLAQLEITYADGTTELTVTDETWRAATGPILSSDIYDGEMYDARLERVGWSQPHYADGDWKAVRLIAWDFNTLVAPTGPPVRRIQSIAPVSIFKSPSGRTLVDFGQNLVGRLRLTMQGPVGQTITLRHAEVLEHGELGTRPLRTARATDHYTLHGEGVETWEPRFTFHGFRYAEIQDYPGELKAENIRAVVCHSDMERTGWFDCSDPLLERLHENVVWSMRGNFFGLPTDCPQRDERLGWTGDIQVFAPAASFLYDTCGLLESWLQDLAAEQRQLGGLVPPVVPDTITGEPLGAAAWGDAAVIVPWVLYQRYGDSAILATQFESMCAWVEWVAGRAGASRLWDKGFQFGDWLDPAAPPEKPAHALTNPHLVATAYFARSAELLGHIAGILGDTQARQHYLTLAQAVRQAFNQEYVTPAGRLMNDSQTAYALAIEFALLPKPEQRQHAAKRLVALVDGNSYRIGTGFVGTPLICDALSSTGNFDAAYRLLLERECPSWLYPVTMGATTIWERWDSMLPDGSINAGEMTSFNHYALGAVADWMDRTIGGLAPLEPGYRRLAIQPRPGGGLTHASARHRTPYGIAECAWKIFNGSIELSITIPPNTTARVDLPGSAGEPIQVGSGNHSWKYAYDGSKGQKKLSVESTVAELRTDPRKWTLIQDTLARLVPQSDYVMMVLAGQTGITLRQGLSAVPNGEQALAAITDGLMTI